MPEDAPVINATLPAKWFAIGAILPPFPSGNLGWELTRTILLPSTPAFENTSRSSQAATGWTVSPEPASVPPPRLKPVEKVNQKDGKVADGKPKVEQEIRDGHAYRAVAGAI